MFINTKYKCRQSLSVCNVFTNPRSTSMQMLYAHRRHMNAITARIRSHTWHRHMHAYTPRIHTNTTHMPTIHACHQHVHVHVFNTRFKCKPLLNGWNMSMHTHGTCMSIYMNTITTWRPAVHAIQRQMHTKCARCKYQNVTCAHTLHEYQRVMQTTARCMS